MPTDYQTYGTLLRPVRALHNKLYNTLYDQFSLAENDPPPNGSGLFATVQQSLHWRIPQDMLVHTAYPWAFVEWYNSDEVETTRMNEVFVYTLDFAIVVMTFADKGIQENMVFNPNFGIDSPKGGLNQNPGVGDLAERVVGYFWENYKTNRFGLESELGLGQRGPNSLFAVQDWTISGVVEPTVLMVQDLLHHPWFRGKQINFKFIIHERNAT